MSDLIARLEAAEEGSRELDAEIELSRRKFLGIIVGAGWAANYVLDKGPVLGWIWDGKNLTSQLKAPHYTTSIDAALTLVPEGVQWCWKVERHHDEFSAVLTFWAGIGEKHSGPFVAGDAATPALALCAAALKARQESEDGRS